MNIKLATLATLASALTISKFIVSGTSLWQKTWLSYFLSIRSRTCSTSGTLCGPATDCYWCHPQVLDHQLSSSKQLQCTCWVERQCQWPSASFRCELSPRQCTPTCTTLCCWPCVLSAVLMCCKCECCKCIANLLSGPFVKCVLVCPHNTTQLGACTQGNAEDQDIIELWCQVLDRAVCRDSMKTTPARQVMGWTIQQT